MNKKHPLPLKNVGLIGLLAGSVSLGSLPAIASEPAAVPVQALPTAIPNNAPTPSVSQLSGPRRTERDPMAQVTSVSQLSDVKPTDWAFQALQSLVERYGCIVGYPDKTYRGNRALSRYEFAAGLNACMDRISELIASATADLVKKEDLAALQKLQEEFAAELATLRGRVDALESRTATLEKQQFSTTTKLSGEVIFSVAAATGSYDGGLANFLNNTKNFGGAAVTDRPGDDTQVVLNNRVRLNLLTSFSGKDLLITGLQAYNFGGGPSATFPGFTTGGSLAGTLGYGDVIFGNSSNARLSFEPQFPTVSPQDLSLRGGNNSVNLYKLLYIFPVANKVTGFIGTSAEVTDAFPTILPFAGEGQEAISRFAVAPASHRVSGGTSQTGLAAAAGLIFNFSDAIDLRVLYGNVNANLTSSSGFPGNPLGAGVFSGSYIAAAQLTLKPTKTIDIGLNYAHSYHDSNILGTGLGTMDIGSILFPSTALTPLGQLVDIAGQGIKLNTLGATVAFRVAPKITLAGSATYIFSDLVDVDASTNFLSWLVGVHVKDVFRAGNSLGLIFGRPLSRESTGGIAVSPEDSTPYHLEGYFKFRVTDNISITPGVFVIFNPEGFDANDTVIAPVVRTTFTF